jgi:hypothetical protein
LIKSLFEHSGAQRGIFFSLGRLYIPKSIWDDLGLGTMLGPPSQEPHWWLAFWFSKLEILVEFDEPGMRHIGELDK